MPIFDIQCADCDYIGEILVMERSARMICPFCGSSDTTKLMAATSGLTGRGSQSLPGPQDTACCGSHPGQTEGYAGPGSCCGRI